MCVALHTFRASLSGTFLQTLPELAWRKDVVNQSLEFVAYVDASVMDDKLMDDKLSSRASVR